MHRPYHVTKDGKELIDKLETMLEAQRVNCTVCYHWDKLNWGCKLTPDNIMPPPTVLVKGCEKYSEDIPF